MRPFYSAFALLLCLAVLVDGTRWFGCFKKLSTHKVDLDALNKHLIRKLAADDTESNLSFIKNNIENLRGGAKRAAQLLVELTKQETCDYGVLEVLKKAEVAGLRSVGARRVEKIILPHLKRLLDSCTSYIDQHVEQRFVELPARDYSLSKFVKIVSPPYSSSDVAEYQYESLFSDNLYPQSEIIDIYVLNHFLLDLAREDPRGEFRKSIVANELTGERSIGVGQAANFDHSFNRYLLGPCQRWDSALGYLFEGAKAVAKIQNRIYAYMKNRTGHFRRLAWTNKACEFILSMTKEQRSLMFTVAL